MRLFLSTILPLAFCLAASDLSAAVDSSSTVFIILMENHNWSSIKGSANAPYINNTLLPIASSAEQYYNPASIHPSLPNYLWLEAGTNFGVTNDNSPPSNVQSTTNHFVTQLKNAGISWKTYQENIDGTSCPTTAVYPYAPKHNPFVYFSDVTNAGCTTSMRPFTELAGDLANNTVPHYVFITPNLTDDMHDSAAPLNNPVKQGDTWLANNLPAILNSNAYKNNGAVFITWDEGTGSANPDGPIGMIVLSPLAKGGGYHNSITYTHSSTLRTLQKIFGVGPLLNGASTAMDLSDLFVPNAIPNADSQLVISNIADIPGVCTVTCPSQPGLSYQLQWKDNIADTWHSTTPNKTGTGGTLNWTDNGTSTGTAPGLERYYRVVIP